MNSNGRKPAIYEFEDCLEPGVFIDFKDGTTQTVTNYNHYKHLITFDDGKTVDLYTCYDSIDDVIFLKNGDGSPTDYGLVNHIYCAISNIAFECKCHIYPKVIKAYLEGDKKHYIYAWCQSCEYFGYYKHIDKDLIEKVADLLAGINLLKIKYTKSRKKHYLIRKDQKRWPRNKK